MEAMFFYSKFNRDISDWKPYKMKVLIDCVFKTEQEIPYWGEIKNLLERNRAIEAYHLNKELDIKISVIEKRTKI